MLVILSADMEAISQLRSPREILASCPEYWDTGRARMTADVAAAAAGLLDAGADEVVVLDNHGSGHPENVIGAELPDGARLETWDIFDVREHGADALLQVGYHGRAGSRSFMPHTYVPELRLHVEGRPISETEGRAWGAGVPLVGITGHAAHREALADGFAEVPFLVVQNSEQIDAAVPAFADEAAGLEAIRAFAATALRPAADAPRLDPPRDFLFEAALDEPLADGAAGQMAAAGWEQTGPGTFAVRLAAWTEARPLLRAAMGAAAIRMGAALAGVDLSSREALPTQPPERVEALWRYVERWIEAASS